ncbi:MAG: hypothetical protein ACXQS8_07965 [Candidatus Helarchaeales archaeon]
MSQDFQIMSYNIIKHSGLEIAGGRLDEIFHQYIKTIKEEIILNFQQSVAQMWEEWEKDHHSKGIADFFHRKGKTLFELWLTKLYPFERDKLTLEFPQGHSSVDAQMIITYLYEKREIDYIRFVLNKLELFDKSEVDAARMLFVNAIKSISPYFSTLVGTQFKIYTENINEYEIEVNKSLFIEFQGAGRIK